MQGRTFLLALLLALFGVSRAVEVKIIGGTNDRFEVRNIQLPGGEQTKLYVITGSPLRLEVDGDRITAEYVEFDEASEIMRVVGPGNVDYDNVNTKGEDYLLDLSTGELNFQNVFIFTEPLDIEGVSATRQPGQIDISAAQFSPCSRCQSEVQDYRFSAERMNFYPGDRLVAFNVTVYLRDLPSFFLPLMVVPLGPQDRRPRFELKRGSETERAEIALDWPYVFGANAFGTTSLRYYADVTPGLSTRPAETILGGTVTESYFGGGFDHRFYTERGRGKVQFFYTPSFLPDSEFVGAEKTPEEYEYTFGYATEEALGGLQTSVLLERGDATNPRIINLTARVGDSYGGFNFAYVTQTYFDLDLSDTSYSPSYDDDEGALRTYAQVTLSPQEDLTFSVGPFSLTNFLVSAGVYEDYANLGNGSARRSGLTLGGSDGTPIIRGGRLLERHTVTLETLSPFLGSSVTGSTRYTGQIYSTTNGDGQNERLVDWTTTLNADQTFPGGSFGVTFNRTILEGETPFTFDARTTPNNRTDLSGELSLTPFDWLDLSVSETYVFPSTARDAANSRDIFQNNLGFGSSDIGPGPLETRAELFNNLDWLDVTLEQAYDVQKNDLGLLGATIGLTSPNPVLTSSLVLSGVYDLNQRTNSLTGTGAIINESEIDLEARLGYTPYAALDVNLGYDFNGRTYSDTFGNDYAYNYGNSSNYNSGYYEGATLEPGYESAGVQLFKPLELSLTAGTATQDDFIPNLTVSFDRDLNRNRMNTVDYALAGRVGPLELSAEQTFDFDTPDASNTTFAVTYPDIVQLSATGFTPLPPEAIGLGLDPADPVTYQLRLLDQTQESDTKLYDVIYETTYGPLFDEGDFGFSDSSVTGFVNLETTFFGTPLGPLGFGFDFNATLTVADDAQPLTYLSDGSAKFTTDFFLRVGLQGTLTYSAQSDGFDLDTQRLSFENFGPTVRLWDDLYVSALLYDIWDFTGTTNATPFNVQPVFFVTLDRCCWAFYGFYDTRDGTIGLSLGYPGNADQVLSGAFKSGLILPRRKDE